MGISRPSSAMHREPIDIHLFYSDGVMHAIRIITRTICGSVAFVSNIRVFESDRKIYNKIFFLLNEDKSPFAKKKKKKKPTPIA